MLFRIAHGGANWLLTPIGLAILMAGVGPAIGMPWLVQLSLVPFSLALFFWYFFRDPDRSVPHDGIACPADGKVVRVDEIDDEDLGPCDRLAIFMSPLDVHVNRFPMDARVRSVTHIPGKHVPAFNKDSDRNERVVTVLRGDFDMKVVQIAGAVARRIVPYAAKGDTVKRGEKLGLIRLGSRCDVIVPKGHVTWTVKVGDRVRANLTKVADTL